MKFAIGDLAFECEDKLAHGVDVHDDLKREAAFAQQSLAAAAKARRIAIAAGIAVDKPAGSPAVEMVKTLEQMGRIAARYAEAEASRKAVEAARQQRLNRKLGKQVQVAREQEKAKQRSAELEKIARMRKRGARVTAAGVDGNDGFDIDVDEEDGGAVAPSAKRAPQKGGRRREKNVSAKRAARNEKYGFGGRKRGAKRNDRDSADADAFDARQNRRSFAAGAKNRPGKMRREQMRSKKASFKR